MATTKFTLLGPSSATNFTSLNGRPSRPPIRSNLSFYSSTPQVIRLRAKHLRKVGVIVLCGGDNDSNKCGNGGGGGSSGGDGDGEAEEEEEEERFEEKPMLGSPWSWKDQEVEGSSGLGEMMLQLYGFEFDDGFLADDIFWMKNAAEYQKYEEKMLKELEIAADLAKARVGNFRLFYLPGGPVSLSPPIEFNAGSIAEIPDKELQAKAMVANFRLFDHPGHVSLSPSIEVNAGSTTAILYACPDKELQADVDGDGALKFVFVSFHPGKLANDELLKKAFAVFDLNKSGHIGLEGVINATALIVRHR